MKLYVDRLSESPEPYPFEVKPAWWAEHRVPELELAYEMEEDLHFDLEAHKMGEDLHLEGRLRGAIQIECGRCLKRYRHALQDSLRLILEPAGERRPADPEAAEALLRDGLCLTEELELGWYRGKEIVLDALFAEVVSLAMPVQPLCEEECAGLCPRCGVDRNEHACACEEQEEEEARRRSPFAVLASLKSEGE